MLSDKEKRSIADRLRRGIILAADREKIAQWIESLQSAGEDGLFLEMADNGDVRIVDLSKILSMVGKEA